MFHTTQRRLFQNSCPFNRNTTLCNLRMSRFVLKIRCGDPAGCKSAAATGICFAVQFPHPTIQRSNSSRNRHSISSFAGPALQPSLSRATLWRAFAPQMLQLNPGFCNSLLSSFSPISARIMKTAN
jgi:hypothetical protein